VGLLKKSRFSSKRHRGPIARATNTLKSGTFVGRAILPADFLNSPTVTYYCLHGEAAMPRDKSCVPGTPEAPQSGRYGARNRYWRSSERPTANRSEVQDAAYAYPHANVSPALRIRTDLTGNGRKVVPDFALYRCS
jgi:hypothetical protein